MRSLWERRAADLSGPDLGRWLDHDYCVVLSLRAFLPTRFVDEGRISRLQRLRCADIMISSRLYFHLKETCMNRLLFVSLSVALLASGVFAGEPEKAGLKQGDKAPEFKIKDSAGKEISLADLTAKGPVLVRLTCGCSGCDKELAYFQAIHEAYKDAGLTSLAVFKEPDAKVEAYVKQKKLNMLYAVDTKGSSWDVF